MTRNALLALLIAVLAFLLVACSAEVPWPWASPTPGSETVIAAERQSLTAVLCPQATPELLQVEPVTSPTGERSQLIGVRMGDMEAVTVTAESGVFTAVDNPGQVTIGLLADTEHHLEVAARVREIRTSDGCVYGGYTLRTRRDRNGQPLVIQQGQPGPSAPAGEVIVPENVADLQPLFALTPDARLTTDFCFLGDAKIVSVGYTDHISVWGLGSRAEVGLIGEGHEAAAALSVAVRPGGSQIATAGTAADPAVRLWDLATGQVLELGRHEAHVLSVAFSPSGRLLASGDNGNRVWVWDTGLGASLIGLAGDVPKRLQAFSNLFWMSDEILVAAGSDVIYQWDATSGQLFERLPRPEAAGFFVEVAQGEGRLVWAAAAQNEAVYLWDGEAETWVVWPASPGLSVSVVEFSPEGRLLAAATQEGQMLFWDVGSGELLASHQVTTGSIAELRFSPDGRMIAVGGWDSPIWLWGIP